MKGGKIMVNNEPPEGYRLLENGEITKDKDIYHCNFVWLPLSRYDLNQKYIKGQWNTLARKIEISKINYTEQQKNIILKKLKKERAFNGDSAIPVKKHQLPLYFSLSENKIIDSINNRFFLKI